MDERCETRREDAGSWIGRRATVDGRDGMRQWNRRVDADDFVTRCWLCPTSLREAELRSMLGQMEAFVEQWSVGFGWTA